MSFFAGMIIGWLVGICFRREPRFPFPMNATDALFYQLELGKRDAEERAKKEQGK